MKHRQLKSHAHYRHISFVSETSSVNYWCSKMLGQVNHRCINQIPANLLSQRICSRDPLDLLVLDTESIDLDQIEFFIFIAKCIKPELPIVVIGHMTATQERTYRAREVLDVINSRLPVQHL